MYFPHKYNINDLQTKQSDKAALSRMAAQSPDYALYDNFYTTVTYAPYIECRIIPIPVEYFPVQVGNLKMSNFI